MQTKTAPPFQKSSWSRIVGVSAASAAAAIIWDGFFAVQAMGFMFNLFFFGALAGWGARRKGWLCGLIVGFPLAFYHMTRLVIQDTGSLSAALAEPDYWRLAAPSCIVSAGMSVMGAMTGVWLESVRRNKK